MPTISVPGSATRFLAAERGTVRLVIQLEHDDRATVVREVSGLHDRFSTDAKSFVHAGTATWWGSAQVQVRAERRSRKDSQDSYLVQVAVAELRVKFRDFDALSTWIEQAGSVTGVSIAGIEWAVTEARRTQAERDVRVQAMQDAIRRAGAYAAAIGANGVTLQRLTEPSYQPGVSGGASSRVAASGGSSSSLQLRPDDIAITAAVSADFEAVVGPASD